MDRWALVTGSARRIGRVTVLELARHGWDIIIHYRKSQADAETLADEIQDMGRKACLAEIDFFNTAAVEKLIPSLAAELGPITALVNNASMFETDAEDPEGSLHHAVNTEAPRILSEAFFKQAARDMGAIVNLLDADPSKENFSGYNRSKIELEKMTLELAERYAPRVRVNGVALGPVLRGPRESEKHFQKLLDATPLGTPISPVMVAAGIRFLLENPSIAGEVLHLDNGAHLKRG